MTLADLHAAARTLARETIVDLDRQGVDKLGADWWCGRLSFALEALCNSLDELDASEELPGELPGDVPPEYRCCRASSHDYMCTLPLGHDGLHKAGTGLGRFIHTWDAS